jgi:hypothetical protein
VIRRNEMRIKDIKSQYRRDFHAVYVCEGCGKKGADMMTGISMIK